MHAFIIDLHGVSSRLENKQLAGCIISIEAKYLGALLVISSAQSIEEQTAVAGLSRGINIDCNLGRQTAVPPIWIIDGVVYDLYNLPQQFIAGIIPVVNNFARLRLEFVTEDLNGVVFQCVTFDENGTLNGTATRLTVIPSKRLIGLKLDHYELLTLYLIVGVWVCSVILGYVAGSD